MEIEKISELLSLYGKMQYNAGSYSQLSGSAEREYINQAMNVRVQLMDAIVRYQLNIKG